MVEVSVSGKVILFRFSEQNFKQEKLDDLFAKTR